MQQIALFPPLWRVSERAKPIDWYAVISDLHRVGGMSDANIADQINVSANTIWHWRNELGRPNHHHGELLTELWVQVTGMREPPRR